MITQQDFERLVPDKGLRDYIATGIDDDNFLNEKDDYVKIYQNVINLAFVYAFSCYLDLKNNSRNGLYPNLVEASKKGNANSQRVLRTMKHIYSRYPLSAELMQFVLSDIYYDFIQGEDACLKKYFPNCVPQGDYWCDKGIGLNDYFSYINENAESSRVEKDPVGNDNTLESASDHLLKLIGFFPFLGTTSLYYDETAGWYVFKVKNYYGKIFRDGIIDTFDLVRKIGPKRNAYFCFLSKIDEDALRYETPNMSKYIVCPMVGVNAEGSFTVDRASLKKPFEIPTDHETIMSYFSYFESKAGGIKNESDISMEQLFNINYKYMKNLALAIADVIGKKNYHRAGARLKTVFEKKHPHAFESYDQENKNWDSIIIVLLIEAGPTAVLREVFYALDDLGDDEMLRTVKRRFRGMLSDSIMEIDSSEEFTEMAMELLGSRYIKDAAGDELIQYNIELVAKAKTQIVLSAIASAEKNNESELQPDCFHTDNIQQHILKLELAKNDTPEKKCELVEDALGDTLRRLICFYSGVYGYGQEKITYDSLRRKRILSKTEIKDHQKRAEEAFLLEAKNEAESLKSVASAVELLKRFVSLCDTCYSSEISVENERTPKSRLLYAVLGKNYIMNRADFDKIIDLDKATCITTQNVDWWLDVAIKLLRYFSTGMAYERAAVSRSYNSIAPTVASYNSRNDSRDGYDTATFALIFDAKELNGKGEEINMLSEFIYDISMRYYCLPNIVRSNNKWWIDPLVIKCSDFDAIFMER